MPNSLTDDERREAMALGLSEVVFAHAAEESEAAGTEVKVYGLIDAACSPDIHICLEAFSDPARCLFDGEAREDFGDVAPWLVEFRRNSPALDWFLEEGYGKDWGIFMVSPLPLARLKTRLKKILRVEDETGKVYFFKFYRPGHLNDYLPVLDLDQSYTFFDAATMFFAEDRAVAEHLHAYRTGPDGMPTVATYDLVEVGTPHLIQTPTEAELNQLLAGLPLSAR